MPQKLKTGEIVRSHKHKGVYLSTGALRSHPASRKHSDKRTTMLHNLELAQFARKTNLAKKKKAEKPSKAAETVKATVKDVKQAFAKTKFKRDVMCPVDNDGYIYLDLTNISKNVKGARIKFTRAKGRKKRTVGLQIEK